MQKVQEACLNSGMKIGLYTDNAVGSSRRGFEAWSYQGLFLKAIALRRICLVVCVVMLLFMILSKADLRT